MQCQLTLPNRPKNGAAVKPRPHQPGLTGNGGACAPRSAYHFPSKLRSPPWKSIRWRLTTPAIRNRNHHRHINCKRSGFQRVLWLAGATNTAVSACSM